MDLLFRFHDYLVSSPEEEEDGMMNFSYDDLLLLFPSLAEVTRAIKYK